MQREGACQIRRCSFCRLLTHALRVQRIDLNYTSLESLICILLYFSLLNRFKEVICFGEGAGANILARFAVSPVRLLLVENKCNTIRMFSS